MPAPSSKLPALVIGLLLIALAVAAPAPAESRRPDALGRALDRVVEQDGAPPGLSVIVRRGPFAEFRTRGYADVARRRRFRPRDHFRIASVAKAFSGAVALSLVDGGRLELGDTIGERLPGALPAGNAATLAQVLRHTARLPDYIRQPSFIDRLIADPAAYISPQDIVSFVRDQPLTPGSGYEYSDTDNIIAGLMAEQATGRSYERLLARLVHRPLGLVRTSLPRTVRMPRPYVHGYDIAPGQPPEDVSEFINPAGAWASGGIVSTAVDLDRFVRGYVRGRLFGRAVRARQRQWVPGESQPAGPGKNSSGLALFRYETRCGTVYGHTGSFPGYRAFVASSGDGRRSVVFLVNAQITEGAVSDSIRAAQEAAVCRALR